MFGLFSLDTGWRLAARAREEKIKTVVFDIVLPEHENLSPEQAGKAFADLARQYELYFYKNEIMLTHKYGTGVHLWRTRRGDDAGFWRQCIRELENKIN